MLVGNQSDAIAFLKDLLTSQGAEVELISTHASLILLAGERAFKMKRAVHYPYLDFSTPEKRLAYCQAEIELNRRTAPNLYLGVRTITRENDGSLVLGGTGPLVDAVVEMRRFGQDSLFDTMARNGVLSSELMTELTRQVAKLHRGAAVSFTHGGSAGIAAVLDINDRGLRETLLVSPEAAGDVADLFLQALGRHSECLEQRRKAGKVRRCHGDLILRNICLIDGVPTLFDCLEFNEALATIDVLYDLAFLLMDLWHRNQRELANLVYNRYLDECDEADGLALVPFFMAIRAAVRAHVTAAQANDAPSGSQELLRTEARAYFDLAVDLLKSTDPMLVALGGLSGTGKSTMASLIAPSIGAAPGARILNTDRIRKRMYGLPVEVRLPKAAYRPEVSQKVYAALRQEAAEALVAGSAVVADAVFDRAAERQAIEAIAKTSGVPFRGFWLDAPEATLLRRVEARRNDPSDATAQVLAAQIRRAPGEMTWQRIDATAEPSRIRAAILALLRLTS
ncbi:aminoglycoside phosphotransferase [Microvirga sp. KLBC 81]|uniref:bifunctional aminoglycoside phosphotransferase/ATP-binding protein n=1 Tax=Microvirga sp. KLBC 81 TaxID=1862707 RepID=UPI000D51DE0D|nr:bifunctional aminoglycoside phosphotransferase/ATP-binding protein [Microvirga sp. KLBC 81]PVE24153.1 aminoglycoside phosphotransferase [Microvirga sp. KLBC 81]